MAADIEVIWVRREQEYFCERGWTGDALNSLSGKSEAWDGAEITGDVLH
jgi:hypothetical protein